MRDGEDRAKERRKRRGSRYQRSQGASTVGILFVSICGCLLVDNDGDCARGIFPPSKSTSDQILAIPTPLPFHYIIEPSLICAGTRAEKVGLAM